MSNETSLKKDMRDGTIQQEIKHERKESFDNRLTDWGARPYNMRASNRNRCTTVNSVHMLGQKPVKNLLLSICKVGFANPCQKKLCAGFAKCPGVRRTIL